MRNPRPFYAQVEALAQKIYDLRDASPAELQHIGTWRVLDKAAGDLSRLSGRLHKRSIKKGAAK